MLESDPLKDLHLLLCLEVGKLKDSEQCRKRKWSFGIPSERKVGRRHADHAGKIRSGASLFRQCFQDGFFERGCVGWQFGVCALAHRTQLPNIITLDNAPDAPDAPLFCEYGVCDEANNCT